MPIVEAATPQIQRYQHLYLIVVPKPKETGKKIGSAPFSSRICVVYKNLQLEPIQVVDLCCCDAKRLGRVP
jgi:hypothetical protein